MTDERWTRLDQADYERKRRREMSSCFKCGSPEPARLGVEGCSDCYDGWPRCPICGGWIDTSLHHPHNSTQTE